MLAANPPSRTNSLNVLWFAASLLDLDMSCLIKKYTLQLILIQINLN